MKLKFTLSSLFMICLMGTSAIAQINTMTINSPASIAGDYSVSVASFGDQSGNTVTTDLVLADDGDTSDANGDGTPGTINDGCQAIVNDVNGVGAVIDRGDCFFGEKADNAQLAGAVVMLVCNNDVDNPDVVQVMGEGPNGEGSTTTILSVSTSYNTCQTLKMALGNETVNATFSFTCRTPNYGPNVVWGDMPGEGDFDGGLNGWTVENEDAEGDGWEWVPQGFSIFNSSIGSATECNGYMHIDSWNNRFDGGTGDCEPCNGGIVSPVIDLTGHDIDGLYVEFDQMFIQFFQLVYVLASNDGGATYKDTFEVNQTTAVNSFEPLRTLRVPLPGYENEDNIRLKFYKNEFNNFGGFYYWGIDDVRLINEASLDMQLNTNFFATNPSFRTPITQVSQIPFLVDIFNNGNVTGENVMVDVEITGPNGTVVFETTNNYPNVPSWTSDENRVFPETFTPSEVGFYNGVYRMNTAGDSNPNNNEIPFFFEVNQDIMSPLPPESDFTGEAFQSMTDGSTWAPGSSAFTLNYAAAHTFYIPNGDGMTISNVRFGVDDTDDNGVPIANNGTVNVLLYAWLRQDEDNSGTFTISSDQTLLVGSIVGGPQIINPAFGSQRIVDVQIGKANPETGEAEEDANGDPIPVELRDDQLYVMVFATESNNQTQIGLLGFDADNANVQNRNFLMSAANLALDSLGSKRLTGTSMVQTSSNDFSEIDGTDITGALWGINELYVEYTITQRDGTEDINESLDISVYPNPTTEFLVVDVDLLNVSEIVSVEILNMEGKRVIMDNFSNILRDKFTFDVSDLPGGMYNVNIRTEEGFISKQVVILD